MKHPEAFGRRTGMSGAEKLMRLAKVPLTRQNYLDLAYMGRPPKELGAEEEAYLPEAIRNAT
jgi:hypothetical protein